MKSGPAGRRFGALATLLWAGLALNLLLVLPAWWRDGQIGSVWLAPEAWLAPALVMLAPRAWTPSLRIVLAALLTLAVVAGAFDGLLRSVLSRPLNVFLDILMLEAGFHLIDGSMGRAAALAASALVALVAVGLGWLTWRLLPPGPPERPRPVMIVLIAAMVLCLPGPGTRLPGIEALTVSMAREQAGALEDSLAARRSLVDAEQSPAFKAQALPGLADRDVYIVLIESYGIDALDQARYAETVRPVLDRWQERLASPGLDIASGQLEAPIRGGQSWLAQTTVLSGLALDNQLWYRMLLDRDIELLTDDFRATGHASVKVSPAIIMDWPEGEQLGFDELHTAKNMGYRGPALGWVTMPDQYSLFHFSERIRPRFDRPVFAQIALISSHWPWTPVIEPIADWSTIGDGEVFQRWRDAGESPLSLWLQPNRMRQSYADSLVYSLEVTFDWARHYLPDDALLLVLGDHQPASIITGRDASAVVPVHVISADPGLLEPFLERGFARGMAPPPTNRPAGMDRLRHWLRKDFADPLDP